MDDWPALLAEERAVFGGAESGSVVALWTSNQSISEGRGFLRMNDEAPVPGGRVAVRAACGAGSTATLNVAFRRHMAAAARQRFLAALELLLLLGGLGVRSRRGFGSLWRVRDDGCWDDPITGEDARDGAAWVSRRVQSALACYGPLGPVVPPPLEAGIRALRDGAVRLYALEADDGPWATWEDAMNAIRDRFYRVLKGRLGVASIGRINPREPSPLLIQIKPSDRGFLGAILLFYSERLAGPTDPWAEWDRHIGPPFPGLVLTEVALK